ncbi:MAG TPA: tetratricopeptide repeat protein [Pyrinomonadaceae bacterium]|jgi:tetratricopeptide (TPR) repeat protein|nr:tetratricopeptide repeat protein [Pyrinomonadaceae bacterium]
MYRKIFIKGSLVASLAQRTAAGAGLLSVLLVAHVAAQPQNKPKIADDAGKKSVATEKQEKTNASKQGDATRTGNRRRQRSAPLLKVNFTTDLPDSDIFLSPPGGAMKKLGKTDAQGKLAAELARGSHSITVSHIGHRTERLEIDVRPGNTDFSFNVALPAPKAAEVASKNDETPAPVEDAAAKEEAAANAAEEVVKRYLDAQQTAGLTADDWKLVETHANTGLEKDPGNAHLKAQSLFAQGQLAYLRGDHASALVAFNKAVLSEPELVAAHYSLGNAYLATNQPAQAVKAYQRAAELNAELPLVQQKLGDAYTKQGKNKEANAAYARAKKLGPLPASSNLDSAVQLMKRKRWPAALKELLEIAKTQPTAQVYTFIGDCYDEMKQPLSASQAYHKATELDPQSAVGAYRYGEKMFELREFAAAMEALERSLALDQTGVTINRKRAREMANQAAEQLRKMK